MSIVEEVSEERVQTDAEPRVEVAAKVAAKGKVKIDFFKNQYNFKELFFL